MKVGMFARMPVMLSAAFLIAATGVTEAGEAKEEYKSKAKKEVLHTQGNLASADGLEAKVVRFTFPPGFTGGKHSHPADVFVYVQSGELTIETDEGNKSIKAGGLYYEMPNQSMRARNMSSDEETVLIVFQVGQQGEPMMVKAE